MGKKKKRKAYKGKSYLDGYIAGYQAGVRKALAALDEAIKEGEEDDQAEGTRIIRSGVSRALRLGGASR